MNVSLDTNNDVLFEFNEANFCFFGDFKVTSETNTIEDLIGEHITEILRKPFSVTLLFGSGAHICFNWEGINNAEAYQGTIIGATGKSTFICESSEH